MENRDFIGRAIFDIPLFTIERDRAYSKPAGRVAGKLSSQYGQFGNGKNGQN